ncbi:GntR family transcriptional regulator [Heliorestis acidaminivorans]|uniref:GntR family transcriptional regulator n=1 Tax=Heliorestis acidaminivorans TaxID=553427 RepID=A0A6I0ET06_9FIRM|nr:GntR family transcriptional regulator [Heliorestis acidaminivorans]KAB2952111.1 GntR family transcriptional regulator [Heliorestis acidaminivorans]
MIDKNSKFPIYYQIEEWLKGQIESNLFQIDKLIPSERELIEQWGVSRHTIRQAIGNLVNQGYLYRIPGKGTFVKDKNLINKENRYTSFSEDMAYLGKELVNKVLFLEYDEASKSMANRLNIREKAPIIKVKRVRIVDNVPISYEMIFIAKELISQIDERIAAGSFMQYYEKEMNLKIAYAKETVESVIVTEKTAQLLKIPNNSPLLLVRTKLFADDGQQIQYSKNYFRGNKYKFSIKLYR